MNKRAAIYVRVSSEKQAEGASPEAQEVDCRALCERQGYTVVEIYRDIEKYRAGGKLVEPSGTRSDRPQFLRMLGDADAGGFDVLVAWREDRLYRGVTSAVIALKERVKASVFQIEIVNGGFNLQTMEVLAWAAGVENEARVERRRLGMARRMSGGKIHLSNPIYGYDYDSTTGTLLVNKEEAHWVKQIWHWYAEGLSRTEIRKRLVAFGAPQSKSPRRKHTWAMSMIDHILRRDDYHTGVFTTRLNGQVFEAQIPVLIDADTFQAAQIRHSRWKAYPAANFRARALVAGLMYCEACGLKMGVRSKVAKNKNSTKRHVYYVCPSCVQGTSKSDCAHSISQNRVDTKVWQRICDWLSNPDHYEQEIQEKVKRLRSASVDAEAEIIKLETQLNDVLFERQRVIAFARKGIITEDDLESQLLALGMQDRIIRQTLAEKRLLTGDHAGRLLDTAKRYRQEIHLGITDLDHPPESEEQAELQFELRRQLIQELVKSILVHADKTFVIELTLDFSIKVMASCSHDVDREKFVLTVNL